MSSGQGTPFLIFLLRFYLKGEGVGGGEGRMNGRGLGMGGEEGRSSSSPSLQVDFIIANSYTATIYSLKYGFD